MILLQDHVNRLGGVYSTNAICNVIKRTWFSTRKSVGPLNEDVLNPIPFPAIALAATAVSLSQCYRPALTPLFQLEHVIGEWRTGTHEKALFRADDAFKTYEKHMAGLRQWDRALQAQGRYNEVENARERLWDAVKSVSFLLFGMTSLILLQVRQAETRQHWVQRRRF